MAKEFWIKCLFLVGVCIGLLGTTDAQTYNFPSCEKNVISVYVSEWVSTGTLLTTLNCTDVDTGPAGNISFVLTQGSSSQFDLNGTDGQLKNKKVFNNDFKNYYPLIVEVRDQGSPALTTTVDVDVYIESENDYAPKMKDLPVSVDVAEDTAIGTKIAGCTIFDQDRKMDGSGGLAGIARVRIADGNIGDRFSIDSETCDIYVMAPLDYETIKIYYLKFVVQDLDPVYPYISVPRLTVNVKDVNDKQPTCTSYFKTPLISENTPVGTVLATFTCTDEDTGDAGTLVYTSYGGDRSVLDLVAGTNTVTLLKTVDVDTEPQTYHLNIKISDKGVPPLWRTGYVVLNVQDVDDNPPAWTSANPLLIAIPESTDIGTSVGQATTKDDDFSNPFKQVKYGMETDPVPNSFIIDQDTGVITVFGTLDRETQANIDFDIYAYSSDKYNDRITAHVTVTISDVNDVAPVFTKTIYTATLTETDAVGTSVAQISADDPDEGLGGTFVYSIAGTTLSIDSNGLVTLAESINNKNTLTYEVAITAVDKGTPSLTSNAYLVVTVDAVNEFTPSITPVPPQSVLEDVVPGTELFQVTATDADSGHDGMILFSLATSNSPFIIDASSGKFKTWDTLDRETVASYNIIIIATDQSQTSSKSSSITVQIDISDVNDNAPSCNHERAVYVSTSYTPGDSLLQLTCLDADVGINKQFTFSISGGDVGGDFSITPTTGSLSLINAIDRTQIKKYVLSIEIVDKGNQPKTGTTTVIIVTTDENVNAPVFPTSPLDITMDRSAAIDSTVATVNAVDADSGVNGEILYFITSGNTDGYFLIDQVSGEIKLASTPTVNLISIDVTASDKGTPSKSGTMTVNINVNPAVPSGATQYTFSILENLPSDTSVGVITGSGGTVTYTIKSGNFGSNFKVVKKANGDGDLLSTKPLDREEYASYQLIIEEDLGAGTTTDIHVQVDVGDKNDNVPVLETASLSLSVVEMSPVGKSVGKVIATDKDLGTLSYEISPVSTLFSVDSDGTLRIKNSPDYETTPSTSFTVIVKDDGLPQRTAEANIAVTIIDVVETVAEGSSIISAECATTATTNTLILTLTPSQFGLTNLQTSTVRFITMNGNGVFDVDVMTGATTVQKPDLLYKDSRYIVWIICEATDVNGNDQSALAILRIDTFVPNENMFAIRVGTSKADLEQNKALLLGVIQQQFPSSYRVGVYEIREETTTARRKLLAAQSVALMYVVTDVTSDGLSGIQLSKTFLSQLGALTVLQQSADGTPIQALTASGLLIELVMPYHDGTSSSATEFLSSAEGIAVIVLVVVTLLIIGVFIVLCCLYCKKKKNMKQRNITQVTNQVEKSNLPFEKSNIPFEKSNIPFEKLKNTPPPFLSIAPVPPASTKLPPIKPSHVPKGVTRSPPPPYQVNPYQPPAVKPPVKATKPKPAGPTVSTVMPKVIKEMAMLEHTNRRGSVPNPTAALRTEKATDLPSDADIDDIDDMPDRPVFCKQRSASLFTNQPLVIGGKTFDGVGFDEATKWRYVYNTKTGNSQWIPRPPVNTAWEWDESRRSSLIQPGGYNVTMPAVTSFDSGFVSPSSNKTDFN